ncbi:hypothetical protein [Acrocarpospora catenulata]|uniref:hypothetical protein n=1 Tax=Acrocarpospora catenulata TaxID=2836182 RepID=UPI001BDA3A34|nr:hypothetical protein [Acrocarpospora catenulata]
MGAVLVTFAAATTVAPAYAAVSCGHTLEFYKTQYEVSVFENVSCNGSVYAIYSKVEFYRPEIRKGSKWCEPARSCTSVAGMVNTPGTQTYCARAHGEWFKDYMDLPPGTSQALKPIEACTTA